MGGATPWRFHMAQKPPSIAAFFGGVQKGPAQFPAVVHASNRLEEAIRKRLFEDKRKFREILGVADESNKRGPKHKENEAKIAVVRKALHELEDDLRGCDMSEWATMVAEPQERLLLLNECVVPAAHGGGEGGQVGDENDTKREAKHEMKCNKLVRIIQMSLAHNWSKGGLHIDFPDVNVYMDRCQLVLGFTPALKSAYRHLRKEKERYLDGRGMRSQPDLGVMCASYQSLRDTYNLFVKEPGQQQGGHDFTIKPEWYPSSGSRSHRAAPCGLAITFPAAATF